MNARLLRLLCLGCGLLLALPPAWCCWVPPVAHTERARASCCSHEQSPKPTPAVPPAHCPCDDLHTVAPTGPVKVVADLSLPAALTVAPVESPRAGLAFGVVLPPLLLSRPLHLVQCVWLC